MKNYLRFFTILISFFSLINNVNGQSFDLLPYRKDFLYGYADRTGKIIIEPKYKSASFFSNDTAGVKLNDTMALINRKGEYMPKPKYSNSQYLPQYKMFRIIGRGTFGYTDKNYNVVIPLIYDYITDINNSYVIAQKSDEYFLINTDGKLIKKLPYDLIYFGNTVKEGAVFKELIYIKKNDKMGCISKSGEELIPPIYDRIEIFSNDTLTLFANGHMGLSKSFGKEILQVVYDNFFVLDNLFFIEKNSRWSILDHNFIKVLPFEFDTLTSASTNNKFIIRKDGKYGVFSTKTFLDIPPFIKLSVR